MCSTTISFVSTIHPNIFNVVLLALFTSIKLKVTSITESQRQLTISQLIVAKYFITFRSSGGVEGGCQED